MMTFVNGDAGERNFEGLATFGEKIEGMAYRCRPGAYALIFNTDGLVAVIRTPRGYFLPGGGIEPGETPEEALARELCEETGFGVIIEKQLAEGVNYVITLRTHEPVMIHGRFFLAQIGPGCGGPVEADHELAWVPPAEAEKMLLSRMQSWAVRTAVNREAGAE